MTAPVRETDPELAVELETLGMRLLALGDAESAGLLWDAADLWEPPTAGVFAIRYIALDRALRLGGRQPCEVCGWLYGHETGCVGAGGRR